MPWIVRIEGRGIIAGRINRGRAIILLRIRRRSGGPFTGNQPVAGTALRVRINGRLDREACIGIDVASRSVGAIVVHAAVRSRRIPNDPRALPCPGALAWPGCEFILLVPRGPEQEECPGPEFPFCAV